MRKNKKFIITKIVLILAVPLIISAYEFGPPAGYTGAPGDNKTGCIASGCHTGTANTGGGSVKISLPSGATSYTPGGPAIPISVLITDTSMKSYGFELTARSGAAGTTNAGTVTPTDGNTQITCLDPNSKGACPDITDIEHTTAGWQNSISSKGSYTYTFNWTPPATNVGNVTMYVAANCGTGAALVSPTHVYLASMALTPAAPTGPAISNVLDAASARSGVVPGSWVAIYGSTLANVPSPGYSITSADLNGNSLPTTVKGVSVNFGTLPAAISYIGSTQINAQVPSGVSGTVPVVVTNNGSVSASFNATVVSAAPAMFVYTSGSNTFPAAQNLNYATIGDPSVYSGTVKAVAGQYIILYLSGLNSSPSGTIISPAINYSGTVTATVGSASANVSYTALIGAGLYQVNMLVPSGLTSGIYPLTLTIGGQATPSGVSLIVGP